jgi:hypothetical protein
MITGIIAAILLLALGVAAKGAIAHALIILGAWLTKNILMLGFLRTRTGKRTARLVRHTAYQKLGGDQRRFVYRLSGRLSRIGQRIWPSSVK